MNGPVACRRSSVFLPENQQGVLICWPLSTFRLEILDIEKTLVEQKLGFVNPLFENMKISFWIVDPLVHDMTHLVSNYFGLTVLLLGLTQIALRLLIFENVQDVFEMLLNSLRTH